MTPQSSTSASESFTPLDPHRVAELNRLHSFLRESSEEDREQKRYGQAAESPEACLCIPVGYQIDHSHIPQRILDVDYGCGDPTQYAREGDTVLDLGSGSGKHCFLMARTVGAQGRVIGIDKTPTMLELARGAVDEVCGALGYPEPNVEFRRGHIENLKWSLDKIAGCTNGSLPSDYDALEGLARTLEEEPLVASNSIDLVVSNCVLNLVADHKKPALFGELFRVLNRGGRAVISDIVAEQDVPQSLKDNDDLWTGCISGALRRDRFLQAFLDAGFHGVEELSSFHWQTVDGIHFHSVTLAAYKGKQGPCWETYRSAYYTGPFSSVEDDDGHRYERGSAVPVCEKTANLLLKEPYAGHFLVTDGMIDESEHVPFDCSGKAQRGSLPEAIAKELRAKPGLTSGEACNGPDCC
ncbi:MAG: methyltransferase domain-containing protein [Planctomycetota bacterium]